MIKFRAQILCTAIYLLVSTVFLTSIQCDKKAPPEPEPSNEWLPMTENVNGELFEIDGIPVLRVWGIPYEQGYAHGYLLAPDFVTMLNRYLTDPQAEISAEAWETGLGYLGLFDFPPEYDEELRGILAGMEARTGSDVYVQGFGRALTIDDLRGLQSDLDKISCSSFTAWGSMTEDGGTISGRNMDFDRIAALMESQIVIVRIPSPESGRLAWGSINWPGEVGCTTGMNEEGVTVSQQDVYRYPPTASSGFTPDNILHRIIVETSHPGTVLQNVMNILQSHHIATGCAPMIAWPYSGSGTASVVPEFDGKVDVSGGYTIRQPDDGKEYQIVANHFRKRIPPMQDCWRYNLLHNRLEEIAASGGQSRLTMDVAWELLRSTTIPESIAMHSVVFEPNKMLMHVAFTQNGQHAPLCTKVTLNVTELVQYATK